jgi:hypothetical protein
MLAASRPSVSASVWDVWVWMRVIGRAGGSVCAVRGEKDADGAVDVPLELGFSSPGSLAEPAACLEGVCGSAEDGFGGCNWIVRGVDRSAAFGEVLAASGAGAGAGEWPARCQVAEFWEYSVY